MRRHQLKKGQLWRSLNSGVVWKMLDHDRGIVVESGDSRYVVGFSKAGFNSVGDDEWELINNKSDSFSELYNKLL